jgi:hypothetical protein
VFKLLVNVVANLLLLLYLGTFRAMADVAADPSADLGMVRNASPALHAALALVLLLAATVLAVHKPGHDPARAAQAAQPPRRALQRTKQHAPRTAPQP